MNEGRKQINMNEVLLSWEGDKKFLAREKQSGFKILAGSSSSEEADGAAFASPPLLLLKSLGACAGIYFIVISRKMKLEPISLELSVGGQRDEEPPYSFQEIELDYHIRGSYTAEEVDRVLELSHKYCPVLHSLNPEIEIRTDYTLRD